MPIHEYPDAEFEPRRLSAKEIENPYSVLDGFYDFAHLPQIREMLRDSIKITICGNWHSLNSSDRADMLCFFEKVEQLIEATHIIYRQRKSSYGKTSNEAKIP